ncbi:MAG: FimB/Mfa2 family fimbrial subunit [Tannerella sp.]|jgi:hypothetical protein|nr:FimB/Mfa2 family fimbrial subunit [Tannerella sp.]
MEDDCMRVNGTLLISEGVETVSGKFFSVINNMRTYCRRMAAGLLLCIGLTACVDEHFSKEPDPLPADDREITLAIAVPSSSRPYTRALSDFEENTIQTLDVLAFRVEGSKEYFDYYTEGRRLSGGDQGAGNQRFIVKVKGLTTPQRFVLIANAHAEVENLAAALQWGGTAEKESALAQLLFTNPAADHKWNSASATSFTPFPMWGESSLTTITNSTSSIGTIRMMRMVAKMDVQLAASDPVADIDARENFSLSAVLLYNTKSVGRIVPDTDPVSYDAVNVTALKASMPDAPGNHTGPLIYDSMTAVDTALLNVIYTLEAQAVTGNNYAHEATCLVVKGIYQNDTQPSYYRLDFLDGAGNYRDILRNHHYMVNIVRVKGRGYATPEEAFAARPVNMVAEILDWDDGQMGDVVFDGQYMLAVNRGEFEFTSEARTGADTDNRLLILTDYPTGWTIDSLITASRGGTDAVTWLDVDIRQGTNLGGSRDTVVLLAEENLGTPRVAWVTVRAGRLAYHVKVVQTTDMRINLTILDEAGRPVKELLFHALQPDRPTEQRFTVRWEPKDAPVVATAAQYKNHPLFVFSREDTPGVYLYDDVQPGVINDPAGERSWLVRPPAFTDAELTADPFLERVTEFTFSVNTLQGSHTETVFLRQIHYHIMYTTDPLYLLDGASDHFFTLRSNMPWRASLVDNNGADADVLLGLLTMQGNGNAAAGEKVFFRTVNDPVRGAVGMALVRIEPLIAGQFTPFDVPLNCFGQMPQFGANSYLVTPRTADIRIPVYHVYAAMGDKPGFMADPGFLGSDWLNDAGFASKYQVQTLWSDRNEFGTDASVIHEISLTGTALHNAEIVVKTGFMEGNALIILYEETGGTPGYQSAEGDQIKWSWHIWSTTDKTTIEAGAPDAPWMMDRNLGALFNSPSFAEDALGFLYQWGRKDPFPGMAEEYLHQRPLFYPPGVETADRNGGFTSTGPTGLASSVNRPQNLLDTLNWYGGSTPNDYLWGDSLSAPSFVDQSTGKSVYDPCPEGWKVPSAQRWSSLESNLRELADEPYIYNSYFPLTCSIYDISQGGGGWDDGPPGSGTGGGGSVGTSAIRNGWYWMTRPASSSGRAYILNVEFKESYPPALNTHTTVPRGNAVGLRCVKVN